ncbi:3-deoxy-7-phosphoheptulonate synthase [Litoribrevibacter euphylliae]|uniref:Phospho-2-dehydro-3-deoxyheptonate aldolase n=1 Tax=Litoribrevibacter euphylliae TaxID=1834034 RepID=A0ABV7HFL7_9GAMM
MTTRLNKQDSALTDTCQSTDHARETSSDAANDADQPLQKSLAVRPLETPRALKHRLPLSDHLALQVDKHRQQITDLLSNKPNESNKLLVITGPCSLHDEKAALDYGRRLKALNDQLSDRLMIVMRTYVEKPRTTTGWKGLAYDPERDGSGNIELGLTRSRALLLNLVEMGLPLAIEALSPMTMLYLDDLISWTAIGARTSESQIHREMISHLGMPVGIKNGTDGSVQNAINAMISSSRSHHCLGMDLDGQIAMLDTPGNPDTHIVLRGGRNLTNYDETSIKATLEQLEKAAKSDQLHPKVIVDCSHDNSQKQHERQIPIAQKVVEQRKGLNGHQANQGIAGIMLESFIEPGNQGMNGPNKDGQLTYGLSITDACISWNQTETLLRELHELMA